MFTAKQFRAKAAESAESSNTPMFRAKCANFSDRGKASVRWRKTRIGRTLSVMRLRRAYISSVPEIKANPTPKNCLPSSRSKKVTQTE